MKKDLRKEWLISTLACTGLTLSLDTAMNINYLDNYKVNKEVDNSSIEEIFGIDNNIFMPFPSTKLYIVDDELYSVMPAFKFETENGEVSYYAPDGYKLENDQAKKLVLKLK